MAHATASASHIDAYVSDEEERPRQALQRIAADAMSFLSRAYPDPVEQDRHRLERFHQQALSFLDRAYAEDPATLVTEEHLPPEQLLSRFHHEAMSFLEIAPGPNLNSTARVARDKARLEQHYNDAMSFLNRADRGGGLVEEQELEVATVERYKLQKYAREAMSFLDKAFREDASIMVDDEEISPRKNPNEEEDNQIAADRAALEKYDEEFGDFLSKAYDDDSTVIVEDADSETSGMEGGLFARRVGASSSSAETSRSGSITHDEEFTDEVYTDDEFQDPEVADSLTLDVLKANLPGQPSRYRSPEHSADGIVHDADESLHHQMVRFEREADDYLEGANVSESEEESDGEGEAHTTATDAGHVLVDSDTGRIEHEFNANMSNPEEEQVDAAEDDEDDQFGADREIEEEQQLSPEYPDGHTESIESELLVGEYETSSPRFRDELGTQSSDKNSGLLRSQEEDDLRRDASERGLPMSSPTYEAPQSRPSAQLPPRLPHVQNPTIDMILENRAGQTGDWAEIPLEKSFYRQLPRGSTIKLRPKGSSRVSFSVAPLVGTKEAAPQISLSDLQRVERERDAVLAALEEIVNERSMLAAQVSEMKSIVSKADQSEATYSEEDQDIDLSAELRDAHETMSKLTEEMEATLSVLDKRYQDTLRRAHKAEERCIRLESNATRLESEFASQGRRLSHSIGEEQRLKAVLGKSERELDVIRKKAERDSKMIEESYRDENGRSLRKIGELSAEVSTLQEELKNASLSRRERQRAQRCSEQDMEREVAFLRRQVSENEQKLAEQQLIDQQNTKDELQRARFKHDNKMARMSSELDRLQLEAKDVDALKQEVRKHMSESNKNILRGDELERKISEIQTELIEARRGQVAAEAEAKHVRLRYEASLKKRISDMGHSSEMTEIQSALHGLREESSNREKLLRDQLEDFRRRAEQAESAATSAERDAREAADVARRSRVFIESERKARKFAETEVQRVTMEARAWEKLAQQQTHKGESAGLEKSSSRRGVRKSPAGTKESKKKKEKSGNAEEGRKKTSHRPRLFG